MKRNPDTEGGAEVS